MSASDPFSSTRATPQRRGALLCRGGAARQPQQRHPARGPALRRDAGGHALPAQPFRRALRGRRRLAGGGGGLGGAARRRLARRHQGDAGAHAAGDAGMRRQRPRHHDAALSRACPGSARRWGRRNGPARRCRHLLERAGLREDAVEIAFIGADRGFDSGHEHAFGRSLKREVALSDDVLLVWAMNGQPLLPQHGFPLRLIVPGWYGMASVKWLNAHRGAGQALRRLPAGRRLSLSLRARRPAHADHAHAGEIAAGAAGHSRLVHAPPAGGRRRGDADGPRLVGRRRAHRQGRGRHRRRMAAGGARSAAGQVRLARLARDVERRRPASTSLPAAPPMPTARRSRWRRRWDAGGFGNNAVHRVRVKVR